MTFEGLDYDGQKVSFLPREDILDYLESFAKKFNLESKIKVRSFIFTPLQYCE